MNEIKAGSIFHNHYELIEQLGTGGFARVFKAKDVYTNALVALKIFSLDSTANKYALEKFQKEYSYTIDLKNQYLLKPLHFDVCDNNPYLVMKLCTNGTLHDHHGEKERFGENELAKILLQMGDALAYLHGKEVYHQDIKPENILIDEDGDYLLSDFGISVHIKKTQRVQSMQETSYGTSCYTPPEKFGKNPKHNMAAGDVFALGVMLYELCEGDLPWNGQGGMALVKGAEVPEIDNPDYTNLFKQLIFACMSVSPADRPTAAELKSKAEFYLREGYWQSEQVKVQQEAELPKSEPPEAKSGRKTSRLPQVEKPVVADKVDESIKKNSKALLFSVIGAVVLCVVLVWGLNSKPKLSDEAEAKRIQDSIKTAATVKPLVVDTMAASINTPTAQPAKKEPVATVVSKPVIEAETPAPAEPVKAEFTEPKMVFVEGGTFKMGSNDGDDDEKPIHSVTVSDFYIGKYEVTVGAFKEFVNASGYQTEAETGDGSYVWTTKWEKKSDVNWKNPSFSQTDKDPVTCVSWNDAQAYIKWLNTKTGKKYRLPSEAEWEYAARGGSSATLSHRYSGSDDLGSVAWCSENSGSKTHPVGTKQANELGIYDMTGNVWEWCSDWYDAKYYGSSPSTNPQGASSGSNRVYRGGSWYYFASFCRVAFRNNYAPGNRSYDLGLRLVLSP